MEMGGWMDLTWQKFKANSTIVMLLLSTEYVGQSTATFYTEKANIQKTMGLEWDITDDNFIFSTKVMDTTVTNKKQSKI